MTPAAVTWSSQNSAIVRISEDGTITGRDVGKTVIKAIAGKKSAEMVVNVVENPDATVHDPTKDTGNAPEEGTEPPDTGTAGSGSGTGSSGTGTGTGTGTGSGGSSGTGTGSGSSWFREWQWRLRRQFRRDRQWRRYRRNRRRQRRGRWHRPVTRLPQHSETSGAVAEEASATAPFRGPVEWVQAGERRGAE